jgi:hypothetical protein
MSLGMLAFGAAALTAAVAFHQGWSPHLRRRQPATSGEGSAERIGRNLREPSARVAAVAGVVTHIPDQRPRSSKRLYGPWRASLRIDSDES